MLLDKQVVEVARSSYYQLWLVVQLRPFLEQGTLGSGEIEIRVLQCALYGAAFGDNTEDLASAECCCSNAKGGQ